MASLNDTFNGYIVPLTSACFGDVVDGVVRRARWRSQLDGGNSIEGLGHLPLQFGWDLPLRDVPLDGEVLLLHGDLREDRLGR